MGMNFRGRFTVSGRTAAAGTVVNVLIPPKKNAFTIIQRIKYLNGGTTQGHTLTVLKPVGFTTLAATATAGQKVLNVTTDPASVYHGPGSQGVTSRVAPVATSSGDYIVVGPLPDGSYFFDTASTTVFYSTVTGNTFSLTNNVPALGAPAGVTGAAPVYVWNLKITGQTDPFTAQVFNTFSMPFANAPGSTVNAALSTGGGITDLFDPAGNGIESSNRTGEPIILQSNNISFAGVIDLVNVVYTDYGG